MRSLAIFGGPPVFDKPRSTSNLIKPDKDTFLRYLKHDYEAGNLSDNHSLIGELEKRLAMLHGAKYCVAVCNGLWGLVLTIN
ncbi:MAG TPA: hypothetical protein VD905_15170, partial [Flavobacteriales bacterium]|nr:hypothetical protein [Flavobacteriales bacterium]